MELMIWSLGGHKKDHSPRICLQIQQIETMYQLFIFIWFKALVSAYISIFRNGISELKNCNEQATLNAFYCVFDNRLSRLSLTVDP